MIISCAKHFIEVILYIHTASYHIHILFELGTFIRAPKDRINKKKILSLTIFGTAVTEFD